MYQLHGELVAACFNPPFASCYLLFKYPGKSNYDQAPDMTTVVIVLPAVVVCQYPTVPRGGRGNRVHTFCGSILAMTTCENAKT